MEADTFHLNQRGIESNQLIQRVKIINIKTTRSITVNNTTNITRNGWLTDMYKLLRDRSWKGTTARTLLSLDIALWSILIYVLSDYFINFA